MAEENPVAHRQTAVTAYLKIEQLLLVALQYAKKQAAVRGPPSNLQGEGWSIFEINNFGQTLHEINNLL